MSILKTATEAVTSLFRGPMDRLRGLRQTLAEIDAKRAHLESAKPPLEDRVVHIRPLVEAAGRRVDDRYAALLAETLGGRIEPRMGPDGVRRLIEPTLPQELFDVPISFPTLCRWAPDQVVAALERDVRAHPGPAGPPMTGRLAALAALDRERAELEREHARLVDQAALEGVVIDHLPAERGRRLRAEAAAKDHADYERLNAGAIKRAKQAAER